MGARRPLYLALLRACAQKQQPALVFRVFDEMRRDRITPDRHA